MMNLSFKMIQILLLLLCVSGAVAAETPKSDVEKRIAVLDIQTSDNFDKELSLAVSDAMRSEIIKIGVFEVLGRDKTNTILNGHICQIMPYSKECFTELGRLLKVDKIIIGKVVFYNKLYYLFFIAVDTKTGLVENIADDTCDKNGIIELAKKTANRLANNKFYFLESSPKPGWNGMAETNDFFLEVLEDPSRAESQRPDSAIAHLPIKPGDVVADIGAGTGFYTALFSKKVGDKGTVYAVDIEKDMIAYLEKRVKKEGLKNVKIVLANRDDPGLAKESVDTAFLSYVYIAISDKQKYFQKIKDILKKQGKLIIVDYQIPPDFSLLPFSAIKYGPINIDPEAADSFLVVAGILDINHIKNRLSSLGSSFYVRVPKEKVIEDMAKLGFKLYSEPDLVPYLYYLVFSKD